MEHSNLLYYQNLSQLEEAQGTGGTVTTVRPGVALAHSTRDVFFNKKKVSYSVTVNHERINGTVIAEPTVIETPLAVQGKSIKVKINPLEIEGYAPVSPSVKLIVNEDTSYTYFYKLYTAYTVTVKHVCSGETIGEDTLITSEQVPETDVVRVSFEPEKISGYNYTGETPIILSISADTIYTVEYEEGANVNLGDIVYYDGSQLNNIPWTDWDSSLGEVIGIISVPADVAPDGNARMITNVQSGEVFFLAMAQYPVENKYSSSQTNYASLPKWNNDSASPSYDVVTYTLDSTSYCDLPIDALSDYPCAGNGSYGYGEFGNEDNLIPPMLNPDQSLNENCMTALTDGNAIADWNGLGNTLYMSNNSFDLNQYINYSTSGTLAGDWYLPSMGELCYTMSNIGQLNHIITEISGAGTEMPTFNIGGLASTIYAEDNEVFYVFNMSGAGDTNYGTIIKRLA